MPMKTCMKRMGALHYLVHLFTATLMTCMWSWIYLTFLAVPGKLTNYCELPRAQDEGMKVWGRKGEGGRGFEDGAWWGEWWGALLLLPFIGSILKWYLWLRDFEFFLYRTLHSLALEQREVSLLLKKLQYYQPCNFCRILSRSKTCTHCNSLVVNIQPNQPYCSLKLTLSIGY